MSKEMSFPGPSVEKYDNYLLNRKENWEKRKKLHPEIYKNAEYEDTLPLRDLKQEDGQGHCVVCDTMTYFKSLSDDVYVCSDECKQRFEWEECKKDISRLIDFCSYKQIFALKGIVEACLDGWGAFEVGD